MSNDKDDVNMYDKESDHIAQRSSNSYEHDMIGLGKCEEVIEERIDPTDGTPIDHITYKPMIASNLFFANPQSKRYRKNIDKVDWSN